ncbi:hypothetical protein RJT34_12652 [Clitoria ternatea]|uniref:chorismate mutase n=1 Tax=Clitoria ternatea TaxID=43366 RepID=A0AAN9JQ78_CLITE
MVVPAVVGRYKNPEENPFFPENLFASFVPSNPFTQFLHPGAISININKSIWNYAQTAGDDGNYAQTAASDLSLLQAISRRIHYGKFVAEVKFRDSSQDYDPLIRAKAISRRIHYGKFVTEVKFRDSPQHYEPLIRAKILLDKSYLDLVFLSYGNIVFENQSE